MLNCFVRWANQGSNVNCDSDSYFKIANDPDKFATTTR